MSNRLAVLAWFCIVVLPAQASAVCSALWADYAGKGDNLQLLLGQTWSLGELQSKRPVGVDWTQNPEPDAAIPYLANLRWSAQPAADIQRLTSPNLRIYWIRYSSAEALLAWGRDDGALCPVLVINGDASIVDEILPPEPVADQSRTLFNVRVMISGNGRLQESLFVGELDGVLVNIEQQSFLPSLEAEGVQIYHRGGGFCANSLTRENVGWKGTQRDDSSVWRVHYEWQGRELRIASTELVQLDNAMESICRRGTGAE